VNIKKALEWHQAQRHATASNVVIDGVAVKASVPDVSSFVEQEGVKSNTQYKMFTFRKKDLDNVKLIRGTEIVFNNQVYQIAYDKKLLVEEDDAFGLDINVYTVHRGTV
jgi:hypothetical protein